MFEKEQELLKQFHERENILAGGSWSIGKDLWIIQEENDYFSTIIFEYWLNW